MSTIELDPIDAVIQDYRDGRMVIIVDDPDRENEGDLACATEKITPEMLSFMMKKARGLICVSLSEEVAKKLDLPLQTLHNNSPFQTAFTVSIDHAELGGVTTSERVQTMKQLIAEGASATDFLSPGNVYPLIANRNGVVGRRGQTEASSDLARIAGYKPSGVICEILNEDGTMARGESIVRFAKEHGLKITSVEDIVQYRKGREVFVRRVAQSPLQTEKGPCVAHVFVDEVASKEHLAVVYGDLSSVRTPLVRIHSECLTGDVLGSRRCDCGAQLEKAIDMMLEEGAGVLLYMRQEGRGIGLLNKLRAYELQDLGHDTVDANLELGFQADQRDYVAAANMLRALSVDSARLLTNNPKKIQELEESGITVEERVPSEVEHDPYCQEYLDVKRDRMGHLL